MEVYLLWMAAGLGVLAPAVTMFKVHELRRRELRLPAATELEHVTELLAHRKSDLVAAEARLQETHTAIAERDQAREEARMWLDKAQVVKNELETLASQQLQLDQVKQELARHREDLLAVQQKQDDSESACLRLAREIVDLTEQQKKLSEGLVKSEAQKIDLDRSVSELIAQESILKAEAQEVSTRLEAAKVQIVALEADAKKSKEELADVLRECSDASERLAKSDRDKKQLEADIAELQNKKAKLQQDVAGLDTARTALEATKNDINTAARELSKLRGEEEQAGKQVRLLHDRLTQLQSEIGRLEGRRTELLSHEQGRSEQEKHQAEEAIAELLKTPSVLSIVLPRRSDLTEKQALNGVMDHLKAVGMSFSSRTVLAFHTCLKIADISPLTVLAGISGTGKSELPRRYAEGMGIRFLQLPVQPRWDSPQDLFGFYNYLERRYKATELARLMVHLDTHNWKKQAGQFEGQMALTLLDEMNLARVEYYFSEFLSRLELRRAGAVSEQSRQQVEIDFDLGPLSSGRSNRVYPSPRLLFVGTMNEDESTQTLSDKVVDRANVLRFSRPAKLNNEPAGGAGSPAEGYLGIENWRRWHKSAIANDEQIVHGWISRLNEALDGLGRPFGHRLNQAMIAYVANHPEALDGRAGLQRAFADQLEQRVLPKLRGIEPAIGNNQRHLRDVEDLILNDLNDGPLASSLAEASHREMFVWSGLHRQ